MSHASAQRRDHASISMPIGQSITWIERMPFVSVDMQHCHGHWSGLEGPDDFDARKEKAVTSPITETRSDDLAEALIGRRRMHEFIKHDFINRLRLDRFESARVIAEKMLVGRRILLLSSFTRRDASHDRLIHDPRPIWKSRGLWSELRWTHCKV